MSEETVGDENVAPWGFVSQDTLFYLLTEDLSAPAMVWRWTGIGAG